MESAGFKLTKAIEGAERVKVFSPVFQRPRMAEVFRRDKWHRKMVKKLCRAHGVANMARPVPQKVKESPKQEIDVAIQGAARRRSWRDIFARKSRKEEKHG